MKKMLPLILGIVIGTVPTVFAVTVLFTDVPEAEWYAESVYNLQEKGIIEGYSDGTYQPSANVNRAELATMLDRLTDYEDQREIEELSCVNELALTAESNGAEIVSGEVTLMFADELTEDEISEILAFYNLSIDYKFPNYNILTVKVAEGMEYEWVCILNQNDKIETAEADYYDNLVE